MVFLLIVLSKWTAECWSIHFEFDMDGLRDLSLSIEPRSMQYKMWEE